MSALSLLPDDEPDASPTPRFNLPPKSIVEIGPRGSQVVRRMEVDRRHGRFGSTPSRIGLVEIGTGQITFLTDQQIAFLSRAGEFRIVYDPAGPGVPIPPERSSLTEQELAACARCLAYVTACRSLPRSRPVLLPVIARIAAERGEPPPGFTSVLEWIDRHAALGTIYGDTCFAHAKNRGNRRRRVVRGPVALAVTNAIIETRETPKGTGQLALDKVEAYLRGNHPGETFQIPSLRTVQRSLEGMNKYQADLLTFGPLSADRKNRIVYERPRPELPLEEVECDHTPMDILVVDETTQTVFGRPDLISFRERCTGTCLGISIGFEAPSYASFLNGLRHAMYPKDMSEFPLAAPWYAFGRFKRLYVDNALHFIGHNIRHAGQNLGFELAEFRPGNPWLKGAQERLLGIINTKVHQLPGSTFSNVEERRKYDEVRGQPVVTLRELRAFLVTWICNEHNEKAHEGLGFLRTLKGIPHRLWDEKIEAVGLGVLPPEEMFVSLAGDVAEKSVNTQGIQWDHVRYGSTELEMIITHPQHRNGREGEDRRGTKYPGTKYRVVRDPFDLGHVYLVDPYHDGRRALKVPAMRLDYATGLTLHQHKVLVANANRELLEHAKEPEVELMRQRARLDTFTTAVMADRKAQGVKRALARWLEQGRRTHERSIVTTKPSSAALSRDFIDPRDPAGLPRPATVSPDTTQATRAQPPEAGTQPVQFEIDADGMPKVRDPGEKVAAAMAARRAALDGGPAAPSDAAAVRERKRRAAGWSEDGGERDIAPSTGDGRHEPGPVDGLDAGDDPDVGAPAAMPAETPVSEDPAGDPDAKTASEPPVPAGVPPAGPAPTPRGPQARPSEPRAAPEPDTSGMTPLEILRLRKRQASDWSE